MTFDGWVRKLEERGFLEVAREGAVWVGVTLDGRSVARLALEPGGATLALHDRADLAIEWAPRSSEAAKELARRRLVGPRPPSSGSSRLQSALRPLEATLSFTRSLTALEGGSLRARYRRDEWTVEVTWTPWPAALDVRVTRGDAVALERRDVLHRLDPKSGVYRPTSSPERWWTERSQEILDAVRALVQTEGR